MTRRIRRQEVAEIARLRLLHLQIGSHFLSNVLANVLALLDRDLVKARLLLLELDTYLEGILNYTRHDEVTFADEMDIIESYLEIQRIRLGYRLHWIVDIPSALRWQPVMPLFLLPLVENAVTHGIERQLGRGCIYLRAWTHHAPVSPMGRFFRQTSSPDAVWSVEVSEHGDERGGGFENPVSNSSPPFGHGIAVENIRERLRIRYGNDRRMDFDKKPDGRVAARITLPLVAVASHDEDETTPLRHPACVDDRPPGRKSFLRDP